MKNKKLYLVIITLFILSGVGGYFYYTSTFLYKCKQNLSYKECKCMDDILIKENKDLLLKAQNTKDPSKIFQEIGLAKMMEIGLIIAKCSSNDNEISNKKELAKQNIEKLENIATSILEIEKIKIANPKFRKKEGRYSWENEAIISFDIENNTDKAISYIYVKATLTSDGREIPWHKDTFSYEFKGGLNPNEKQHLDLVPNMFSDWAKLGNRKDYKLNLEILRVRGANDQVLWDIE